MNEEPQMNGVSVGVELDPGRASGRSSVSTEGRAGTVCLALPESSCASVSCVPGRFQLGCSKTFCANFSFHPCLKEDMEQESDCL